MLLYLKLSFGKAMILSALFESLLLVMDYFALLMNIYIFHNMEEVWESHVIQGSLVVVLGKALLLFAVLIIRNHMEKNLWLCWQIQNGFGLFFSLFSQYVLLQL